MGAERRLENRRMKVTKRMEVSCLDTGRYFIGETEDVSDSGIRACLDRSPSPGASVMVRLFWDDSQTPVETFGRVAWSSPIPAGEGIEVGLMLGAESNISDKRKQKKRPPTRYHRRASQNFPDISEKQTVASIATAWHASDDQSIETRKTLAAISSPLQSRVVPVASVVALSPGESFEVDYCGTNTWARIIQAGEIDACGNLQLSIEIKNQRLWKKSIDERMASPDASDNTEGQTRPTSATVIARNPWARRPPILFALRHTIRHTVYSFQALFRPIHNRPGVVISTALRHVWIKIPLYARAGILQVTDTLAGQRTNYRRQNRKRRSGHGGHIH
ncbi:MAG: PilZ domain-containing protein [Deltaproteobacteria bacterium]|nr:PilZ domain-containing protein [Deltaproteobacteria bacterium]